MEGEALLETPEGSEPTRTRLRITRGTTDIGKAILPPSHAVHSRAMAMLLEGHVELIVTRPSRVPPPRFHLLRYYGVLSAHASLRAEVVPKKADVAVAPPPQLPLFDESAPPSAKASAAKTTAEETAEPSRHPWSWLLKRVFAVDIMVCSRCGGAVRLVKIATRPDDHVLGVLGSLRSLCARSARGGARSRRARFAARTSRRRADREHSPPARASLPLSSSTAPGQR